MATLHVANVFMCWLLVLPLVLVPSAIALADLNLTDPTAPQQHLAPHNLTDPTAPQQHLAPHPRLMLTPAGQYPLTLSFNLLSLCPLSLM